MSVWRTLLGLSTLVLCAACTSTGAPDFRTLGNFATAGIFFKAAQETDSPTPPPTCLIPTAGGLAASGGDQETAFLLRLGLLQAIDTLHADQGLAGPAPGGLEACLAEYVVWQNATNLALTASDDG